MNKVLMAALSTLIKRRKESADDEELPKPILGAQHVSKGARRNDP